jgi:hypothetical protein
MNAVALPPIATLHEGGFYAGRIRIDEREYALMVAPKADGEHKPAVWHSKYTDIAGAKSWYDGLTNTRAMAEGGSKLAAWALALSIGGFTDWYLPAVDELEIVYRTFKPTTDTNSQWGRSGINLSAVPPAWPYALDLPKQTGIEAFRAGGAEAFEADGYWTSTQHASDSDDAWSQYFNLGSQSYWFKDDKLRARVVRRLPL